MYAIRSYYGSHYEVFPDVPERWKHCHRLALSGEVQSSEGERFVRANGDIMWLRRNNFV